MRSWKSLVVMCIVAMAVFGQSADAGHRKCCKIKKWQSCHFQNRCVTACSGVTRGTTISRQSIVQSHDGVKTETEVKEKSSWKCGPGGCRLQTNTRVNSSSVSGDWNQEAQQQADEMAQRGTSGHVRSAQETARRVLGHSNASVRIGVGINGQTCRFGGMLVADATSVANGTTYHCRIWLQ